MKLSSIKPCIIAVWMSVILLAVVLVAETAGASARSQEKEKAEWLKISKEFYTFQMPKGFDILLPEGAGGGGEIYVNFDLYPKSSKTKTPKITTAVYLASHPSMTEYMAWAKEYTTITDRGPATINGIKWQRYVPEGRDGEKYECYGTIKAEKLFEFCLDGGSQAPTGKFKKTYQHFLKSVKLK